MADDAAYCGRWASSFYSGERFLLTLLVEHNVIDDVGLTRKVKIQIYKPHDILRITADKSTAEYAANDIEMALQHTETKRMNLKNYMHLLEEDVIPEDKKLDLTGIYSQKDLDVVSALTKTSIAVTSKNLVSCVNETVTRSY